MDVSLFLILSFILALFLSYFNKYSSKNGKKFLPGPPYIPIIGYFFHVKYLQRKYTVFQQLTNLCKQYGPVSALNIGMQYTIAVEDFETAKKILSSDDWQARNPSYSAWKQNMYNKEVGIMFAYSEYWKENRRFSLRILKEVGFGKRNQQEMNINMELEDFKKYFEMKRIEGNGVVSIHRIFKFASLSLVWKTLTGVRASEEDDKFMTWLIGQVERVALSIQPGSQLYYAFPIIGHLFPNFTSLKDTIEGFGILQSIFKEIAEKKRKEGRYKIDPNDFIDYYLKKIDEIKIGKNDHPVYNDEQMIQGCCEMFVASADTTGDTLEFAIMFMMKNPKIQAKVQAELDTVYPNGETPQYSDVDKLPYTQAVLFESARLNPVTPTIPRTSIADTTINGCPVPKDAVALLNFQGINRNRKYFDDPDEFKPERFLDENGCLLKNASNMFLQFGMGKRFCVGMPLAKMSGFLFFTTFFQQYFIEESSLVPEIDVKSIKSGIVNQPVPFSCVVKLRQSLIPLP